MITAEMYEAAYRAYDIAAGDRDLPDEPAEHLGEWRVALCWTSWPASCGFDCWVEEAIPEDPDRGWPKRGTCRCGWTGPTRQLEVAAAIDLVNHGWPGWQDQPEEPYSGQPGREEMRRRTRKGARLFDSYVERPSRVLRCNVCGPASTWGAPSICRGVIPSTTFTVIEVCVCTAHWDIEAAAERGRAEAEYRAEWRQRNAERWRNRHAPVRHVHVPGGDYRPADEQLSLF